jgi:Zn finger protein HypA/HybF involved in hydrogenase expression
LSFFIEHNCPQCGAPIQFEEAERLLICPFCKVRNFMVSGRYLRTMFVPQVPGESVIFAPYLHFKGSIFFQRAETLQHKQLQITPLGMVSQVLPPNLGFKTQTHRLKIVSDVPNATFLRFSRKPAELLSEALVPSVGSGTRHHNFIGETMSLLYFPMVVVGGLLKDGITGEALARLPVNFSFGNQALESAPKPELTFLPTLCPHCSSPMEGEGISIALVCLNCHSAWEAVQGQLVRRKVQTAITRDTGSVCYLPFWKMNASASTEKDMATHGGFARLTGKRPVARKPDDTPISYYAPAFKVRPKSLLIMATRLTIAQFDFPTKPGAPRGLHHPITMPSQEAIETIPVVLCELAYNKRDIFSRLHTLAAQVEEPSLVFLPFRPLGTQLVEDHTRLAVEPKAVDFGRYL